jgi:N-acetylneuraminic acid mutarotase
MQKVFLICLFISCLSCNPDPVETPDPVIVHFTPEKGSFKNIVKIAGNYPDPAFANTTVEFNGISALVESVTDTLIIVTVPENATTGKIAIEIKGKRGESLNDFTILPGNWRKVSNVPGEPRANVTSFTIGNAGYMLGGVDIFFTYDYFLKYDLLTKTWTEKSWPGGELAGAVSAVIDGKAYVGFGFQSSTVKYTNAWWEYDGVNDAWTRKKDFPGEPRSYAAAVAIGNKIYAGLGINGINPLADWWEYDPIADEWTQKANCFYGMSMLASFAIDNKAYAGVSFYNNTAFFQYDPETDTWTTKANYPGVMSYGVESFVLNGRGYVAGGGKECWSYNAENDQWDQVAFFEERTSGAVFAWNNEAYYATGFGTAFLNDLWKFTP